MRSSVIAAVGYDAPRRRLRVRFVGGAVYDYLETPPEVFEGFLGAPSKGQFVNSAVKPCFRYERVS